VSAALGLQGAGGTQTISVMLIKLPAGAARLGWKEMHGQ
jgi:hypothetical protein